MNKEIKTTLPKNRPLILRKRTIFIAVGLVLSIYFTQQSLTFPFGSGFYPTIIGFAAIGLSLAELIVELRGGGGEFETIDISVDEGTKGKVAMRRAVRFLVWILMIYAGIALLGYNIAVTAFLVLFMRLEGHARWWIILTITAIAVALELYYFPQILGMKWPSGLLQTIVKGMPF
jgi:hypothetical protein